MPKLNELSSVASNTELLSMFAIAIKRAAYVILASQNPPALDSAWAKRVLGDAGFPGRAEWYASRALEGALVDNQVFRDAIDAALAARAQGQEFAPILSDAQFVGLVQTWVVRFAAQSI
jgi:hypothetical protein